ncbi:MAG: Gfo/Idh/MocA family oxidoreductase [SAR202 cluster bacterium]|nr:Gfo/Idh/MocA family oxidoreductase [SAR202 cluster bacterium]
MPTRLRIGLIGATSGAERWGARAHIPALLALRDELDFAAVCTAHKETALEAQKATGARLAFWDYQQLVQCPDIDIVSVAVRIPLHRPIVMAAIDAGKHVFCEWPLGMDSAQGQEMAKAAKARKLYTAIGTQGRFSPAVMYARDLIKQGFIGKPLHFNLSQFIGTGIGPRRSDRWWSVKAENGGGALNISMGHALDTMRCCLGEVSEAWGITDTLVKETTFTDTKERVDITSVDTVMATVKLKGGASGVMHASTVSKTGSGFRFDIYGDKGHLLIEAPTYVQYSPGTVSGATADDKFHSLPIPKEYTLVASPSPSDQSFQVAQLYHRLADAIRHGQPFHPNFDDGLSLHRTLEAINRSSTSGRWEKVT